MSNTDYDFSGYITRYNVKCADGRTILPGAFAEFDGERLPLVYMHNHTDNSQILGHVDIEAREDGLYGYGKFNNTPNGLDAKEQVANGDCNSLSIWANHLVEQAGKVMHGALKEVSLVLSGANPGAYIDNVALQHSDGMIEDLLDEAIIYSGDEIILAHSDDGGDDMTIEDVLDTLDDDQAWAVGVVLEMAEEGLQHDDVEGDVDMDEVGKILQTLDDRQMKAFLAVLGSMGEMQHDDIDDYDADDLDDVDLDEVMGDDDDGEDDDEDYDEDYDDYDDSQEGEMMHSNIFDQAGVYDGPYLSHDDLNEIVADAKNSRAASLKEIFLQNADYIDGLNAYMAHDDVNPSANQTYGIRNVEWLFPEAKNLDTPPFFIKRDMEWVDGVLSGVHHLPFTRVKSMFADITEDTARALGYIKGNEKKEEFFDLQHRSTTPQTIYKKQKLDRDDILDITDFNVVLWLKAEMRLMLNEEIARAILIGDGRSANSPDKISEQHIRPVWTDDELFTIHLQDQNTYGTNSERAMAYIRMIIRNRKKLKSSGTPALYITEDLLTDMLLLEDGIGRPLYDTVEKLQTKLRVSKIVSVPVMENQTRTVTINNTEVTMQIGMILVNLQDYCVGTDKGGQISMFDDFDIDYNQEKYLMETRMSGALVKPKTAMVLEHVPNNVVAPEEGPEQVHLVSGD